MKTTRIFIVLALALASVLALAWLLAGARLPAAQAAPLAPTAGVIYVDADAVGAADGLTWATAFTNVQDALTGAGPGDEIWVAEGMYTPTAGITRTATFQLKDGVALYGGFVATETLRTQRDWETHVTVLSGDLDGNDVTDPNGVVTDTDNIAGTNAYHVVTGSGVTATAVLDGFTVTGGKADNPSYPDHFGGGMINDGGSPQLANIIFSGNAGWGGGMYNRNSDPTLTNVTFSGNVADYGGGGGMRNESSNPTLTNVTFSGNDAVDGGGMYNRSGSSPTLANCILWGNTAGEAGNQIHNVDSTSVISYSLVQGSGGSGAGWDTTLGTDGDGNIDADPQFVRDPDPGDGYWSTLADNDYGDLRLGSSSPAIDAGDNAAVSSGVTTDLGGNPRFFDVPFVADTGSGMAPIVDMGAYEADWHQILLPLVLRGSN
jgi:hypothetical protein